ncbi:MAG TPA: hypothetical protein PLE54_16500 [Burkholderiaceae bacterium]|nr:hypothetical protein [Burkholderiaceae bacterium]
MSASSHTPAAPRFPDEGPVAAILIDENGSLQRATVAAAELLGFSNANLVGRGLGELAADGWQGAVANALERLRSGSTEAFEAMLVGRSGRRSLLRMVPRRTAPSPGETGHVLFWRPVSFSGTPGPQHSEAASRRLAYGLLRKHDDSRGKIAGVLHSDVASLITSAKLAVERAVVDLQREDLREAATLLLATSARLREALENVRRISTELLPSSLDDLGLAATIEWLCRRLKEAHPDLRTELQLDVDESAVAQALKLDLYRIVEEALFNAGRHAGASLVRVTLVANRALIQLIIEDDGTGFDASPFVRGDAAHHGLGLHSIGSRISATHGSLSVESMPGAGTSIVATWPADEASGPSP